jgi:ABC-type glycerol-3-phosphate transport system substrate-binding protein
MTQKNEEKEEEMKKERFLFVMMVVLLTVAWVAVSPCKAADPVTLRILSEEIDVDIPGRFATIGKMFEAKHPNIKVEFVLGEVTDTVTKAHMDMAAGGKPSYDLAYCFIMSADLADGNYIIPLDTAFPKELEEIKKGLTKSTADTLKAYPFFYNGHVWGLPFSNFLEFFFYRTDLFKKAGLSGPPKTNEEFLNYCRKLKGIEPGVYPYMADWNDDNLIENWPIVLERFGTSMWNQSYTKSNFNNEAGLKALQWMKTLYDEKLIAPDAITCMSHEVKAKVFESGQAAMTSNFPFLYSRLNDPKRSKVVGKWGADILWGSAKHRSITISVPLGLSIVKGTGHEKEALEFMKFIYSPEIQDYYGKGQDAPLTQGVYDKYKKNDVLVLFEKVMNTHTVMPFNRKAFEEYKVLNKYIPNAILGKISLKEALDKCSKEIDELLAKK